MNFENDYDLLAAKTMERKRRRQIVWGHVGKPSTAKLL